MTEVIKRKDAMLAGLTKYFTGKPCKHGHIEQRSVLDGTCAECARLKTARHYKQDPIKMLETHKRWRTRNADYREKNKDRINANSRRYNEKNRPLYAQHRAKRRAGSANAVPVWFCKLDEIMIAAAHREAKEKTICTGTPWEVDHIVPLTGKLVCGLHIAANIQVITRNENRRKSNSFAV